MTILGRARARSGWPLMGTSVRPSWSRPRSVRQDGDRYQASTSKRESNRQAPDRPWPQASAMRSCWRPTALVPHFFGDTDLDPNNGWTAIDAPLADSGFGVNTIVGIGIEIVIVATPVWKGTIYIDQCSIE